MNKNEYRDSKIKLIIYISHCFYDIYILFMFTFNKIYDIAKFLLQFIKINGIIIQLLDTGH